MARKSIIIIGAGMGGLAAGIYDRINGFQTRIFEMHSKPGGQCAVWKRQGYLFDACIHHLFGCDPSSRMYDLWHNILPGLFGNRSFILSGHPFTTITGIFVSLWITP